MRKHTIVAAMMAAAVCAMPLSAGAQDLTPEEIIEKSGQASAEIASATLVAPMNLDLGIDFSFPITAEDGTTTQSNMNFPVKMTGQYDIQMIAEPLQLGINGELHMESISMMGQEILPKTDLVLELYAIRSEDGSKMDTYTWIDDGSNTQAWVHNQKDWEELTSSMGIDDIGQFDSNSIKELFPNADLDYELTDKDKAYGLALQLAMEELIPDIQSYIEEQRGTLSDEDKEVFSQMVSMLDGVHINYQMDINKETFLMDSFHVDFDGSDLTTLNSSLGEFFMGNMAGASINVTVNDMSMDGTYTYNNVSEITVPAEARATVPQSSESE